MLFGTHSIAVEAEKISMAERGNGFVGGLRFFLRAPLLQRLKHFPTAASQKPRAKLQTATMFFEGCPTEGFAILV